MYFVECGRGEGFGEISLFDKHLPRFCVVHTVKPTHCLVIDTLAISAMNRVHTERTNADLLSIIKDCELLKLFSYTTKKKMIDNFEKLPDFVRGKVLHEEDKDEASYIYLVRSGEFMISKKLMLPALVEQKEGIQKKNDPNQKREFEI